MEEVIKVKGLSKSYGNLMAVDNFTFSVNAARYSVYLEQTAQERAQQ